MDASLRAEFLEDSAFDSVLKVLQDKENRQETMRELGRSGYKKEEIEEVVGTYNEIFEILQSKGKRGRSSRILRLRQPTD